MDYTKITTDELVQKIITEIGVPLPIYDYNDYKAYISVIPTNLSISGGSHGIEKPEVHKTFRNACLRIVLWSEGILN